MYSWNIHFIDNNNDKDKDNYYIYDIASFIYLKFPCNRCVKRRLFAP